MTRRLAPLVVAGPSGIGINLSTLVEWVASEMSRDRKIVCVISEIHSQLQFIGSNSGQGNGQPSMSSCIGVFRLLCGIYWLIIQLCYYSADLWCFILSDLLAGRLSLILSNWLTV